MQTAGLEPALLPTGSVIPRVSPFTLRPHFKVHKKRRTLDLHHDMRLRVRPKSENYIYIMSWQCKSFLKYIIIIQKAIEIF